MDNFDFWWYIIAALIYFITRKKKRKKEKNHPDSSNTPLPKHQQKSFEDLLREITKGREPTEVSEKQIVKEEEIPVSEQSELIGKEKVDRDLNDEESRKIYEQSIRMATDSSQVLESENYIPTPRELREGSSKLQDTEKSYAQTLMEGLDADETKKAIIYSEIFNRKY